MHIHIGRQIPAQGVHILHRQDREQLTNSIRAQSSKLAARTMSSELDPFPLLNTHSKQNTSFPATPPFTCPADPANSLTMAAAAATLYPPSTHPNLQNKTKSPNLLLSVLVSYCTSLKARKHLLCCCADSYSHHWVLGRCWEVPVSIGQHCLSCPSVCC